MLSDTCTSIFHLIRELCSDGVAAAAATPESERLKEAMEQDEAKERYSQVENVTKVVLTASNEMLCMQISATEIDGESRRGASEHNRQARGIT